MKFAIYSSLLTAFFVAACGSAAGAGPADPKGMAASSTAAAAGEEDLSKPSANMVELEVSQLLNGPTGGVLVVLKEKSGQGRVIPMIVGDNEGDAIARRLSRQRYLRPLTHDLMEAVFKKAGMRVMRLEVDDLQDGVFLARLYLEAKDGEILRIDSRPSDGIALALGAEAPILMAKSVIDEIGEPAANWEEIAPNAPSEEPEEEETWPQQL